jgi:glycosyltransferase involved in cell wall biosynthesis
MTHLLSLDQSELRAMGQRARQMIVQEFSWEAISQKLLEAYAIHASQH